MPRAPNTSPQAIKLFSAMVSGANQWRHGYDLMQASGLKSGTLYPLLIRLTESDLLESQWSETEGGRPRAREVYRLTKKGISFASSLLAEGCVRDLSKPVTSP